MKTSEYTFETYVTTPSNRLAYLAARKICESPGIFNPLYIYGWSGMGKSHLLHAMTKEYESKGLTAIYLSSTQFLEEMIEAIKTGTMIEFREKYYQTDVLLIDRLQYISEKETSQEELLNVVAKRLLDHKQTVVSGIEHPLLMGALIPELSACLTSGLCVEISMPDYEERSQIIFRKLKERGIDWPLDACRYMALNISSGVHQIEGEINKILACREML